MPSSSTAAASPGNSHNVVGVHYKVGKKIGEGSFGIIYQGNINIGYYYCQFNLGLLLLLGVNLLNNQPVAIKFEPRKSDAPQLRDEYRTYKIMAGSSKKIVLFNLNEYRPITFLCLLL
jgi:casein kinase 1